MKGFFNVLKKIKKVLDFVGKVVSTIVNTLLLTLVYFVGVGLTAMAARIKKHHFFETGLDPNASSYWTPINLKDRSRERFYRQF